MRINDKITWYTRCMLSLAMDGIELSITFLGMIFLLGVAMAIDAYVLSVLWDYVVPILFPKAVELGYIAGTMAFSTMFWICVGLFVIRPADLKGMISTNKGDKK